MLTSTTVKPIRLASVAIPLSRPVRLRVAVAGVLDQGRGRHAVAGRVGRKVDAPDVRHVGRRMDRVGKLGAVAGASCSRSRRWGSSGCRRPSRAAPTASSAPSADRTSRWWSRGGRGSRSPAGRCGTAPRRSWLAFLVATTPPPESSREIPAPAGRPVTYTCSTLPRALKVAALALLAKTSASAVPARKREIPRKTKRADADTESSPKIGQAFPPAGG